METQISIFLLTPAVVSEKQAVNFFSVGNKTI